MKTRHLVSLALALAIAAPCLAQQPSAVRGACASCGEKRCVPEQSVKKELHVTYCAREVDLCFPYGPIYKCLFGKDCSSGDCGKLRTKHVLIKHVRVEECPETRCVPKVIAPACSEPCETIQKGNLRK